MNENNQARVTESLLLGLSGKEEQKEVLFVQFLGIYLVTITGNLLIILAICSDPHLHICIHVLLANHSRADICFSSVFVPKILGNHSE
jgi:olfactory receptor